MYGVRTKITSPLKQYLFGRYFTWGAVLDCAQKQKLSPNYSQLIPLQQKKPNFSDMFTCSVAIMTPREEQMDEICQKTTKALYQAHTKGRITLEGIEIIDQYTKSDANFIVSIQPGTDNHLKSRKGIEQARRVATQAGIFQNQINLSPLLWQNGMNKPFFPPINWLVGDSAVSFAKIYNIPNAINHWLDNDCDVEILVKHLMEALKRHSVLCHRTLNATQNLKNANLDRPLKNSLLHEGRQKPPLAANEMELVRNNSPATMI